MVTILRIGQPDAAKYLRKLDKGSTTIMDKIDSSTSVKIYNMTYEGQKKI